jgi:hypothetical protein
MVGASITLDEAVDLTRTGDIWLFRGRTLADRAIRLTTNSPVNHVGVSVVLDDLPPLLFHAELGRSLPDLWSGTYHRGVQLHDLRAALRVWTTTYGQQAWLRQLDHPVTREMEDELLRTIARLDGTPFPTTARLAARWLRGRMPSLRWPTLRWPAPRWTALPTPVRRLVEPVLGTRRRFPSVGVPGLTAPTTPDLETAYCAEVVARSYEAMGLLPGGRRPNWYDAGRFWSGDDLRLLAGAQLGGEIAVEDR